MFHKRDSNTFRKVVIAFLVVTSLNILLDFVALGSTEWMVRTVEVNDGENKTTIYYHSGVFRACGPEICAVSIPNRGAQVAAAFVIMGMFVRCLCITLVVLTMFKRIRAYPHSAKLSFISGIFNVVAIGSFGTYLAHTHAFRQGVTFGYSFALACVVAILSIGISFLLGWERRHEENQ